MQHWCRQAPRAAPQTGSAQDPVPSLPTQGWIISIPWAVRWAGGGGTGRDPLQPVPRPLPTLADLGPPSPPGCLTTLRLPKPPLRAGVGLQSPAPAGAAQLTVGAIPNGSQGLRDDRRRRGSPTWQHPLSYLHPGPLQHLDGVLCREVELGFADPARHVVAHGVRAQLVGDLEVQRLLAPSQAAVPCGRAPAPPEKKSPGRYSICCRVS